MSNYPFWTADKFSINSRRLVKFLSHDLHFGLYKSTEDREEKTILIRIVENIVQVHSINSLKRTLVDFIESDTDLTDEVKDGVLDRLVKLQPSTLGNYTTHLPIWSQQEFAGTSNLDVMIDNDSECYLPFKNGVVVITEDDITLQGYEILENRLVWESSVIDHEITVKSEGFQREAFKDFVHFALKNEITPQKDDVKNRYDEGTSSERYQSAKSAFETGYGYLIHNFNPPDEQKMVVFVDIESTKTTAQGRNGKSLTQKTVGHYKRLSSINGKGLQNSNRDGSRFHFQSVKIDTQVIVINDLKQNFDFEQLFSQITDDFTIEGKGTNQIVIPQERKPKMCLNTNYLISGTGASYEGRQHVVEFGNYFNRAHNQGLKPKDIIGCNICDKNFSSDDWDAFYNYGFHCVQRYLKEGLYTSITKSQNRRKLIDAVEGIEGNGDLVNWLDEWCSTTRVDWDYHKEGISETELFQMFRQDRPDLTHKWDASTFHTAVFEFATTVDGYDYNPHKASAGFTKTKRRWRKGPAGKQENYILITHDNDDDQVIDPIIELRLISNTTVSNSEWVAA